LPFRSTILESLRTLHIIYHVNSILESPMNQPNKEEFVKKKVVAGICGILIGSLGVHKFVLGLTTPGIIMLVATVLTCGFAAAIFGVVGLIEGVIYLTKDDDQFYQDYAIDEKGWF